MVCLAVLVLVVAVGTGLGFDAPSAHGDESASSFESPLPTPAQTKQFLESDKAGALTAKPETDLHAAQTMPHRELERTEALELAEEVFAPELEATSGIYGELEPQGFLSNHAAVVPVSSLSDHGNESAQGLAEEHPNMSVLLESALPLRTETESGNEEPVDLSLQHAEGELQPQNPLAEVGIPDTLGEGITLTGPEVELNLPAAPEGRVATDADGEFAFYPEIAANTDLIVAPTARGLETMADIRSAEAPKTTTYQLTLPEGAELKETPNGGAEVVEGDRSSVVITPPSAIDAAGDPVETQLTVSGKNFAVSIAPSLSTVYPVLVDPNIVIEDWYWGTATGPFTAWSSSMSDPYAIQPLKYETYGADMPGLDLTSGAWGGNAANGDNANWTYVVPRYNEDMYDFGNSPTSWLWQFSTEGIQFLNYGNFSNYPVLVLGLVDVTNGWQTATAHYGGQGEMTSWGEPFAWTNEFSQHRDKVAQVSMVTYENEYPAKYRVAYLPNAQVVIVDEQAPEFSEEVTNSEQWMNTTALPIKYRVQDTGLGVVAVQMSYGGTTMPGWGASAGCQGYTSSPCPRILTSNAPTNPRGGEKQVQLTYNPASLPTGKDEVKLSALDPLGTYEPAHVATTTVRLRVDHTAPEVSLSGPLTEQATLGTRRSSYGLRINAKDGVAGAPQSGLGKVEVLVDGKKVVMPEEGEWAPNCQTENCSFVNEWALNTSEYASGPHEVQVIATDAVGNKTTKVLHVELHPPAPTLSVSGTMTEQATLGTERPNYTLRVNASALAESPTAASPPTFSKSFGNEGAVPLSRPGAMAMDPEGDIWVVDSNDNRLEQFNQNGTYLSKIAPEASSKCKLNRPTAVAIDASGDLWVTDTEDKRVVEFSQTGGCLGEFGGPGTTEGKFAGAGPEAIAIDPHGNIWVADTYGGRLEKFSEGGKFIRSVATKGKGNGQLGEPTGIAIAPGGNIYVADWEDDKVAEYGEGGQFIRQFGSEGSEAGQFRQPTGIAIDNRGDVWIAEQNNERVQEFTQAGEYVGSFGGAGQFSLSYPTGIVTDTRGDIWVSDANNNRVDKWVASKYFSSTTSPSYLGEFGAGHETEPMAVAVDPSGRIWTVGKGVNKLQRYNSKGEWEAKFSGAGKEPGKLEIPTGVTVNGGHVWVSDSGNNRIEEFSETGAYLGEFGEGGSTNGKFNNPRQPAVDANHHVWVPDPGNNRVQELSESGTWLRTIGNSQGAGELSSPEGVAIGPGNTIYVADYGHNRVVELSETGTFIRQIGGSTAETGQLNEPLGVYLDGNEHLWVTERGSNRVKEYTTEGVYLGQFGSTGAGPGQLNFISYLTGDEAGHLFVADTTNGRISEWGQGFTSTPTPTYAGEFGMGHQIQPSDVAIDPSGRRWVTDWGNGTLQRYNSRGEWEASFAGEGKEPGKLIRPIGVAISGGHVWVSDTGNDRIEEFSESGAYLFKFGEEGNTNGKLIVPGALAIDPSHHIWVADTGNNRVQEFTESGTWIRTIGTTGEGKLSSPESVAVGPGNTIYVADYNDNRVVEFSETGTVLHVIGGAAAETGQLSGPVGVYVDNNEHLWVVERANNRVKEYTTEGVYLGEFGSTGAGPGQLNAPTDMTGDEAGHLFVGDLNNSRISEWSAPTRYSQISTEISVGGVRNGGFATSCATKTCNTSGEWTLNSSSLSVGSHEVKITATDGLGNTTTKTMNIKVGDTTKPALSDGGELIEQPEGWVQQEEGSYGFHATATDAGYGVTELAFRVDGKTVAAKTQSCPAGACSATVSGALNAREYTAGSHKAEFVARDGAGNVSSKLLTINVDPEGHISAAEAQRTIEAVEETIPGSSETNGSLLAPPDPGAATPRVATGQSGQLEVTETNVPIALSEDPAEGVEYEVADALVLDQNCFDPSDPSAQGGGEAAEKAISEGSQTETSPSCTAADRKKLQEEQLEEEEEIAAGRKVFGRQPITISPVEPLPGAGTMTPVEGSSALSPNTYHEVDTVFRPMAQGGYSVEDIRSASAPEHYAYELNFNKEQELVLISPQEAVVKYTEGGPVAVTIRALPASDAIGTTVPTHLSVVAPNIVVLTVEHRGASPAGGQFVYPVVDGTGWEGGYRTITVEMAYKTPPPEEEEEGSSVTERNGYMIVHIAAVGPMEGDPRGWFVFSSCIQQPVLPDLAEGTEDGTNFVHAWEETDDEKSKEVRETVGNCMAYAEPSELVMGMSVRGFFHVHQAQTVFVEKNELECKKWGPFQPALVHCYANPNKAQHAISVGGDFRGPEDVFIPWSSPCITVYGHLLSVEPYREAEEEIWSEVEGANHEFEPCHWPAQ